jgi:hypothetical protein
MRWLLSATVLVACGIAPAAPVPADLKGDRERLERLWADLATYDPVVRTRAVFALIDHPAATAFLARKALPVDASADQLKAWLADLNSDDATVREPAFAALLYFPPQIGLTPAEQLEQATTDDGRRLLASVWRGEAFENPPGTHRTALIPTPNEPHGRYTFEQHFRTGTSSGSYGYAVSPRPVADLAPDGWRRAAVAALVLHRIDTTASRDALDRLAGGHQDALPTRTAARLLKATVAPASSDAEFRKGWDGLLDGEPIPATGWALSLGDRPDDVKRVAGVLPAIEATPDDVKGWLKALDDADPKVWKPAFEKLLTFRPVLAIPTDAQCETVTTDHGRAALFHLTRFAPGVPDEIDVKVGSSLLVRDDRMELNFWAGGRLAFDSVAIEPLEKLTPIHWQRARLAVVVLERVATPDAKAALRQLADGHPDILPTKEAKAALERLNR